MQKSNLVLLGAGCLGKVVTKWLWRSMTHTSAQPSAGPSCTRFGTSVWGALRMSIINETNEKSVVAFSNTNLLTFAGPTKGNMFGGAVASGHLFSMQSADCGE